VSSTTVTGGRLRTGRTRGRGRKQHALFRLRGEIPLSTRIGLAVFGVVLLLFIWWLAATVLFNEVFLPSPVFSACRRRFAALRS